MNVNISETPSGFAIQFERYDQEMVIQLKNHFTNKSWDPVKKRWWIPKSHVDQVMSYAAKMGTPVINSGGYEPEVDYVIDPLPELMIDTTTILKRQPYPFQRNGIAYLMQKKRALSGDEMGLGKTLQVIAAIALNEHLYHDALPAVIVCPSSLKINWQREIEMTTRYKAMILRDDVKNNWWKYYEAGLAQFFIVNYEGLKKYFVDKIEIPEGKKLQINYIKFKPCITIPKTIAVDESHRVKSLQTQQTKFTRGLCKGKTYIYLLSGTPVLNKPKDLVSQLGIMDQMANFCGNYNAFMNHFCAGFKEASNLKELNWRLNKHCFYRRSKSEVLKDLPAKMRQRVYCDISTQKEYDEAKNNLAKYLIEYRNATEQQVIKSMRGEIMVRIGILKNIAARGKFHDVAEFIEDTIESGEKIGIFAHQHSVIDQLKERFPQALCITGRENQIQRQNAVDAFQNRKEIKLILLGIQAAGVGLTLTAASRCGFIELGWTPAIHDQCEDRFHRIGQVDSVQCTYFLGKDTIDEWVYKLIEDKRSMANAITGATNEVEEQIIDQFINLFNQKSNETKQTSEEEQELASSARGIF